MKLPKITLTYDEKNFIIKSAMHFLVVMGIIVATAIVVVSFCLINK